MDTLEITPEAPASKRRHLLGTRFEIVLWMLALVTLGHAGWMWADSILFQWRGNRELAAFGTTDPGEPGLQRAPISVGTPIARLAIPRLELALIVAEGTSTPVLQRAVGHLAASARPGEHGNVVLAGHRDTFFRSLEHVRGGDLVMLETAAGRDLYEVEWTRIVEPTDLEIAAATDYPALTLITCYPFQYVGNAPQRFIVRARQVGSRAQATRQIALESSPAS